MTEREVQNRIKLILDTLYLVTTFPNQFEEKIGKKGLQDMIDRLLDELITYMKPDESGRLHLK
jgi:hypothetical protein